MVVKVNNNENDQREARSNTHEESTLEPPKNMNGFQKTYRDNYKNPRSKLTRAERRHRNMLKALELKEQGLAVPRFPHNHNKRARKTSENSRSVVPQEKRSRTGQSYAV